MIRTTMANIRIVSARLRLRSSRFDVPVPNGLLSNGFQTVTYHENHLRSTYVRLSLLFSGPDARIDATGDRTEGSRSGPLAVVDSQ